MNGLVGVKTLRNILALATLAVLLAGARTARAAEAGLSYPITSEASDTRRGSVLFYNLVTSNGLDPSLEDTRLSITNHSDTSASFVRLFFVEGGAGLVASSFICLTATQTATFQASDLVPGFRGFLVAVSVDGVNGCPFGDSGQNSNRLSGDAFVKTGLYQGALPAMGVAAQFSGSLPGCDSNSVTASLPFNGTASGYNRLPRMLQIDNIGSPSDGQRTLLVLNRASGDLAGGFSSLGPINGTLFDNMGTPLPFSRNSGVTQLFRDLDNKFPLTSPKFRIALPSGQTGWAKLNLVSDVPVLGAAFFRPGGAVNLRARTLSTAGSLTIPVESPSC